MEGTEAETDDTTNEVLSSNAFAKLCMILTKNMCFRPPPRPSLRILGARAAVTGRNCGSCRLRMLDRRLLSTFDGDSNIQV